MKIIKMAEKHPLGITTIGGGSGQYALLSGLSEIEAIHITAVVSMVDSGGSTGRLRDELGILPPGDILKCILALCPQQETFSRLLQKRFQQDNRLRGHNAGNMLLTMLSQYAGSFPAGIQALAEILEVKGDILPVTTDRATLVAELKDGTRIYGEQAIDMPKGRQREKIKQVFLVPHYADHISVYPPVLKAIDAADFVIIGPGDLFTSIIPNLLVPGVAEALQKSRAKLILILNIMTKFGETNNFTSTDFVSHLEPFIGRPMDAVIYNNTRPDKTLCDLYAGQNSEFVESDFNDGFKEQRRVYVADLLESSNQMIRHDSKKLSTLLKSVFFAPRSS